MTRGKYTFWSTLAAWTRLSDDPMRLCENSVQGTSATSVKSE